MAHAVCLWQAHCVQLQKDAIRNGTQGVTTPCYKKWIATPSARNDGENNFAIFNYAFSYAYNFEIMSCNESYDFNHNNFYHNGNNQSLRGFAKNRDKVGQSPSNPICLDCHAYARNDKFVGLFYRNDYGEDFIFDFGNNFNYGFLFNRKINSTKKNFNQGEER